MIGVRRWYRPVRVTLHCAGNAIFQCRNSSSQATLYLMSASGLFTVTCMAHWALTVTFPSRSIVIGRTELPLALAVSRYTSVAQSLLSNLLCTANKYAPNDAMQYSSVRLHIPDVTGPTLSAEACYLDWGFRGFPSPRMINDGKVG
jgi:hypothetical protein